MIQVDATCSIITTRAAPDAPFDRWETVSLLLIERIEHLERTPLMKGRECMESNPLRAFFKPPCGFEDRGPHQSANTPRGSVSVKAPRRPVIGR